MVIPAPASVQTREGTFTPTSVSGHGAEYAGAALGLPVSEAGDLRCVSSLSTVPSPLSR